MASPDPKDQVSADFDKYVADYRAIIDKGAWITGEKFEYYIELRLNLIKSRLASIDTSHRDFRILDFGCGIGTTEQFVRERFPHAEIHGIDSSPESVAAARKLEIPNTQFVVSESTKLPFPDEHFDLVYSNGTFHHIETTQHARVFAEIWRCTKRGGNVFICENNPLNPLVITEMRKNPFDRDAQVVYPWRLRSRFVDAGFAIKDLTFYMFYPGLLRSLRWTETYLRKLPLGGQYFVWGQKK